MSPYCRALASAAAGPFVDTLAADIEVHLRVGWVLSTPDYFLMARSVGVDWPESRLLDPSQTDLDGAAWFIWAVAGDWRRAAGEGMALAGWKPFVIFHRRGRPRIVESARLLQVTGD